MAEVSATKVLEQLARALPQDRKKNVIVVGSLAAAYHFFQDDPNKAVSTKDLDCMFTPHAKAVVSAKDVTEQLLANEWRFRPWDQRWDGPGTAGQPVEALPLVRLSPPPESKQQDWFLELLGAPAGIPSDDETQWKVFDRIVTPQGHFALVSFGFLGFAQWSPIMSQLGIMIGRPSMMALANLLHHPRIRPDKIGTTNEKRSNKDLGRVLALAYLTQRADPDGLDAWAVEWHAAMQEMCPAEGAQLAGRLGNGLNELLNSPTDLDDATRSCAKSLLASMDISPRMLVGIARRVLRQVELLQLMY